MITAQFIITQKQSNQRAKGHFRPLMILFTDGEKDEHETMIMGLSIALGNAAAAIVCLLIAVAICRR